MAEEVSTGGLKSFRYSKVKTELDEERKRAIAQGYEQYYERKTRERRNKLIFWIIGFILLLVIVSAVFFV